MAVEQFMHHYYQVVLGLRELNDVLLQFLDEAILKRDKSDAVIPINERFQLRCGYIEVTHTDVFAETPSSLLEVFVLAAKDPNILGMRASTIRLIRESLSLIDHQFRNDPNNCQLFLELLRSPHHLVTQLKRMKRYGILGAYLPEFGRVIGQMQYGLFHIYTVDEHTLLVIKNMHSFQEPEAEKKFPIAAAIVKNLAKIELLYIAGLYHDIAKGRGGNHSTLGAADVAAFCHRHNLEPRESRLVKWLVENHLLMSLVAQKQDISDPEIIHNFALTLGDILHLDYLYALTVADMCATNPNIWNGWRDRLLSHLYLETKRALQRGLENPIDRQQLIEETQQVALRDIRRKNIDEQRVLELWQMAGDNYFLKENADDIVWHTEAILNHRDAHVPLILVKESRHRASGQATQIFIRTDAKQNVFAAAAAALDQLRLNIQDARIDSDPVSTKKLKQTLLDELGLMKNYNDVVRHRRLTPRQLKHFTSPTRTSVDNSISDEYTVLEVVSPDRPGLLALIGRIFVELNIHLVNAKISTLGERVEDIFYITNQKGQRLSDPTVCRTLQETICRQLDNQVLDNTKTSV
jgi:[protein-PII] uridylyltransferase